MKTLLLCSDLDRTLIPNGSQAESELARPLLTRLALHPKVRLAYVSGRDRKLVEQALTDYQLPAPDFVIGDVGTTLYRLRDGAWLLDPAWQEHIGADWNGLEQGELDELIAAKEVEHIWLQPPEKQNTFKLSYFTDPDVERSRLIEEIRTILEANKVAANLIWSLDEAENLGLLDVLPASANKLEAITFLLDQEGIPQQQAVFAGDSGNDLDALTSGLQAILVKNAAADVRREAIAALTEKQQQSRLYCAQGSLSSLNGNYAAGVVEGMLYFFPELRDWIEEG